MGPHVGASDDLPSERLVSRRHRPTSGEPGHRARCNAPLIKWIALYAPLNWPRGVPTRPEVDQEVGGTKPSHFAADVTQLEMLVELITTRKGCFTDRRIRSSAPMSDTAWMRWAYLHMDHHLRQFGCVTCPA